MIADLHIQAALRGSVTYLKKSYFTTPFKVANITEDKQEPTLRLMLMSSSPGILDGDRYQLKIELEENTSVHLQTQSYQRLFQMEKTASQQMDVHLSHGASFNFLPHPSVPHAASSFFTHSRFFLSGNCTLLYGEVLTCGRKLNGEIFMFKKYHSITDVYVNGKLVLKENLLMQPETTNLQAMGQLESYTHQASFIYLNEQSDVKMLTTKIDELLSQQEGIVYGITTPQINGILVRVLGHKAEQLHTLLKEIANLFNF